ncbi:GNAT family N-acetyltransferase [Christiangramia crocea]|uniref:GNAT family N-acetyltransferase n=1 Tax=Christiangramia crocea TaxID=2904124 RepID=A0A9X1V0R8_9FLAO|nr:GNAT family N-acetyltransferase [Gramella crocea]MCG9972778.1 GNAT family N-acetyltransferase [Gramella crocea]
MIRRYVPEDKSKVKDLLKRNTPEYFDPSEERELEKYLDEEIEDYFVFEQNSQIVGAGGINYFPKEKLARISWDIIDPELQGQGIGRKLAQHRIDHIKKNTGVDLIIVRTSQLAYRFYEKMGFELEKIERDFWAKGFDLYQMKKSNKS